MALYANEWLFKSDRYMHLVPERLLKATSGRRLLVTRNTLASIKWIKPDQRDHPELWILTI